MHIMKLKEEIDDDAIDYAIDKRWEKAVGWANKAFQWQWTIYGQTRFASSIIVLYSSREL